MKVHIPNAYIILLMKLGEEELVLDHFLDMVVGYSDVFDNARPMVQRYARIYNDRWQKLQQYSLPPQPDRLMEALHKKFPEALEAMEW